MSIHCNPKISTDNLILYLDAANKKSYPNYGIDYWGDISKNEKHFEMTGVVTNDNNSFLFSGNVQNYFSSPDNFIHAVDRLTIEMWVLPSVSNNNYAFYSFVSTDYKTVYHSITNQNNLTVFGPNAAINTNQSIVDNSWKCITRTSLRSSGDEKIYINGKLVTSSSLSPTVNFSQPGIILLGQIPNAQGSLDANYAYFGKIAIFKIYNTILTTNQVKSNFNALKGRFYPY